MGAYLYCIVPAGHVPPAGVTGLDGAEVTALSAGEVAAWASRLPERPTPSVEALARHNAVVAAAVTDRITPVPVRFGEWFPSAEAAASRLAERVGDHLRALATVAGALEYGVRVIEPGRGTTGREYMAALARRHAAGEHDRERGAEIAAALRAELGDRIRGERVEPLPTGRGIVSLAHLVERADFEAYRAAVAGLRDRYPQFRFLVTGPWPPYSFVA
jgi:hypothetical protein